MVHAVIKAYIREEGIDDAVDEGKSEPETRGMGIIGGPRGSATARARFKNAAAM